MRGRRVLDRLERHYIGFQISQPAGDRCVVGGVPTDTAPIVAFLEMFQVPGGDVEFAGKARLCRQDRLNGSGAQRKSADVAPAQSVQSGYRAPVS